MNSWVTVWLVGWSCLAWAGFPESAQSFFRDRYFKPFSTATETMAALKRFSSLYPADGNLSVEDAVLLGVDNGRWRAAALRCLAKSEGIELEALEKLCQQVALLDGDGRPKLEAVEQLISLPSTPKRRRFLLELLEQETSSKVAERLQAFLGDSGDCPPKVAASR